MDKPVDMEQIRIDPSPFQLVEKTSLHKVSCTCVSTCKNNVHRLCKVKIFFFLSQHI